MSQVNRQTAIHSLFNLTLLFKNRFQIAPLEVSVSHNSYRVYYKLQLTRELKMLSLFSGGRYFVAILPYQFKKILGKFGQLVWTA